MSTVISLFGVVSIPEMETAALDVLRSGRIANGEYVEKFEKKLGDILGQPNVVTTVDMTSALFLALHLAGVVEGDEVLTTAFACLSTNTAIAHHKAKPIWVDVSPKSVEMDVADLQSKISEKTKAVILYHIAGYPGPAREIADICKQRGIVLIEDCDNALFAERESVQVGFNGDFSIYSFYPNRQINTTEGGALICKSPEMALKARKFRRFGINPRTFRTSEGEINSLSVIPEIGWSVALNNFCAALGCAQLDTVQLRHNKTQRNVQKLKALIKNIVGVTPVPVGENSNPAYWVFLLYIEDRDKVLSLLKQHGVMASCLHMRNDIYTGFGVRQSAQLPNTDYLQEHIMAIPCGWWLDDESLKHIAYVLEKSVCMALTN
nr:DegT/DnrJ/EryC1/StrS family aminotransferase [Halomonas sp.]